MSKRLFVLFSVLIAASMVLAACGGATPTAAPATQAPIATEAPVAYTCTDAVGCAVIEPGQTIKIGMGAPMTGDNAAFGKDISQGAMIAIDDGGEFNGFKFDLIAEDDQGAPEGGAAVANKLVSDPTVVAIAGHIFSGATLAAIPIYEKAGLPMMSPSATSPDLPKAGSP